jgi:hypothetical protein
MKRKQTPASDRLVPREVLENARHLLKGEKPQGTGKCVICGFPCAPTSTEGLCWVCRRLKISAWHETDQQMPAQE